MSKYPPFAFCLGGCSQTSSLLVTVSTVTMLTLTDTPPQKLVRPRLFSFTYGRNLRITNLGGP